MQVLAILKKLPTSVPTGTAHSGGFLSRLLVDKGERYGAAFAFGYAKAYYGDKFIWKGHGADLWLGVGGLLAASIMKITTGGRSGAALHLERVADSGISSALNSLGASMGLEKAGKAVSVTNSIKGAILGYIEPAVGGSYLSAQDMRDFAKRR